MKRQPNSEIATVIKINMWNFLASLDTVLKARQYHTVVLKLFYSIYTEYCKVYIREELCIKDLKYIGSGGLKLSSGKFKVSFSKTPFFKWYLMTLTMISKLH